MTFLDRLRVAANEDKIRRKLRLKKIGSILLLILSILILIVFTCLLRIRKSVVDITRVDSEGTLYYAVYKKNYDSKLIRLPFTLVSSGSCSAFYTQNENSEYITGRNYDLPHKDKEGELTGLNVVLRLNPKKKYASINVCDACWFSYLGLDYYTGALDDGKTNQLLLAYLPYLAMDGINEKGLTCSILALDIKDGETAVSQNVNGKEDILLTVLLRNIIDECANLDEAINLASSYNVKNMLGYDYHLFATDETGKSAVFEWRYNTFTVTYTDAVTNFYVSSDDAEDVFKNGDLQEKYTGPADTLRTYLYGYGHGYNRFNKIVTSLNTHLVNTETFETKMTEVEATLLLKDVSQKYDGSSTSYTQYSCLYNNTAKSLTIYANQNYSKKYTYKVTD